MKNLILIILLISTSLHAQDLYPHASFFDSGDFAVLQTPIYTAKFNRKLGGGWNEFYNRHGQPVLSEHPGESALTMYASGNDPTAGVPYPMSGFGEIRRSGSKNYYVKEVSVGDLGYAVAGSTAPFWQSQDIRDDAVDTYEDWSTIYNDNLKFGETTYIQFNTPIFFKAKSVNKASNFWVGDELDEGTPAYHLTANFVIAADIIVAKELPKSGGIVASVLSKTRTGVILRFDINTVGDWCVLIDTHFLGCGKYDVGKLYRQGVRLKLELLDGSPKAYIDGLNVLDYPQFINGMHEWTQGVGGRSIDDRGWIAYGYREVLDLDEKVLTRSEPDESGGLRVHTKLYSRNKLRGTNFPTFFHHPDMPREVTRVALKNGTIYKTKKAFLAAYPNELVDLKDFHASYIGSADGKRGVMLYNVKTPDNRGHILVSDIATAVNSSPRDDYFKAQYLPNERAEMSAIWLPEFNSEIFNRETR